MLLEPLVDAYVRHLSDDLGRAPTTVRGYRQELLAFARGNAPLEGEAIAAYVGRSRSGATLAPSARNRRLIVLRGFCRYLVHAGHLAADPTAGIRRATLPRRSYPVAGVEDLRLAMAVLQREPDTWRRVRDQTILELLFQTGLRVSELIALDLPQADLLNGWLHQVRRKGRRIEEMVLNAAAAAALQTWLAARPQAGELALFVNKYGRRISFRMVQKRLKALGEAAGLPVRLHPHKVRHAHATELLNAGTPLPVIGSSLGHASVVTTQIYVHANTRMLRTALGTLPALTPSGPVLPAPAPAGMPPVV